MQHKKQRRRASSAKPSQDNTRRTSGPFTKQVNKIDWLQNLYGGIFNTKKDRNSKAIQKLLYGIGQENDALNSTSRKYKDSQQLYEQNLNLKRQLNSLKKEVQLQKGKTEVFRRKNSQYTKKLNIEYQKEMYWGATSSNMVMGIKNQYETIKQKYNQKCREYEQMAKEFILCQTKEDKIYIRALEEENTKLKNNLDQAKEELKLLHHGTITSEVEEGLDAYKRWKFQLQQVNLNLQSQVQLLRAQNKGLSNIVETYAKKIEFLDRLIIEKDNAEHAARKKMKKLQKEKQDIMDIYTCYKTQNEEKVALLEEKIKKIKENAEKQAQQQITIFRKQLEEKNDRVAKLEKQIAYLTTLLSYWKPLDELNELVANKMLDNGNLSQEHNFLLQYSKSIGGSMMQFNKSRQQNQIHVEEDDAKSITNSIIHRSNRHSIAGSRKGSGEVHKNLLQNRNISDLMTKSIDLPKQLQIQRVQITADKRHSQNSVKCRKIHHDEIVEICEYLKYRFIGLNVSIEQIKSMFEYKIDESDILMTEQQESWKKEYINLEETKQIFSNRKVFGLNDADAQTLARYLIEDSQNDYVYCDPANENLRNVVKSIVKNIIGGYTVQYNLQDLRARAEEMMNKYQTNLESALKTTAPKGLISKKKILELFKGLGIELTPEFQDYYLGKLAVKSENLSNLKYSILFEK